MANHATEQRDRFEAYVDENLGKYPNEVKRQIRNKILFTTIENDNDFLNIVNEITGLFDKQATSEEVKDGMVGIDKGTNAREQLKTQLKTKKNRRCFN